MSVERFSTSMPQPFSDVKVMSHRDAMNNKSRDDRDAKMSRAPSRSPTKVRVARERLSFGNSPLAEEHPVKDTGLLGFSLGKLKPSNQKMENKNTEGTKRDTLDDWLRKRSKSFGGYDNISSNAVLQNNNNAPGQSRKTGKELSEFLLQLWKDQQLCDIVIRANGREFLAHKLALAAQSEKFTNRYCERERIPQTLSEVNLVNSSAEATEEILRFIYTKTLNVTEKNVDALICCAKQLGVTAALALCREFLMNFNSRNVLVMMQIAEKHGFVDLVNLMESSVFDNFTEISKLESFLHSDFELVIKILTRDSLKIQSELDLFFAVVGWIDFNRQERLHFAPRLLAYVPLEKLSAPDLVKYVEPQKQIFEMPECRLMLYTAFRTKALQSCDIMPTPEYVMPRRQELGMVSDAENRSYSCRDVGPPIRRPSGADIGYSRNGSPTKPNQSYNSETYQRKHHRVKSDPSDSQQSRVHVHSKPQIGNRLHVPKDMADTSTSCSSVYNIPPLPVPPKPNTIMVVGGVNPFDKQSMYSSKLVEQYNPRTNNWHLLTTLPEPRHHLGATILDGFLYIVGGSIFNTEEPENLANPTDLCFRYCPNGNFWTRVCSLGVARMYHGLTTLEGVMYAVGGHDGDGRPLRSVEYFNPDTDSWGFVENMSQAKIGVATVGFHESVYVVGGFYETLSDKFVLDTVECYDPRTNSWEMRQPLPIMCCHGNLVVAQDMLFLIGGSNMAENSSAVTSLSSIYRYYEEEDLWERITDMMIPRHDAGSAVIGSKIYIVGGVSSLEGSVLADVECLDVDNLTWSECQPLSYPALGLSCCALGD